MKPKITLCVALGLSGVFHLAFADEPAPFPDPPPIRGPSLPGGDKGKMETYWLAPYVQVSEGFGGSKITWFTEDGRIRRQTAVGGIEPGFIFTVGHGEVMEGVNETWKIVLPPEPKADESGYDRSGFTTSTPDSRVFVYEFPPKPGWVELDIYIHGQLANTVGPFPQYKGEEVQLSDDGSTALIVWKDETKTTTQVVTTSSKGAVRLRVDCDNPVDSPIAAPDGAGVLVRPNGEASGQNTYMWYTQEGKIHSLEINSDCCVGWIPGTHQALFSTSVGETPHYQLVDWDNGKKLWEIACPGNVEALAIGLTPKLILFAVAELYQPGPWRGSQFTLRNGGKDWIRKFYAVSVQDGSIVASWRTDDPERLGNTDRDKFLSLDNKLFYLTADEFTEIHLDDIFLKKNGWK